jgi:hypothetical protein
VHATSLQRLDKIAQVMIKASLGLMTFYNSMDYSSISFFHELAVLSCDSFELLKIARHWQTRRCGAARRDWWMPRHRMNTHFRQQIFDCMRFKGLEKDEIGQSVIRIDTTQLVSSRRYWLLIYGAARQSLLAIYCFVQEAEYSWSRCHLTSLLTGKCPTFFDLRHHWQFLSWFTL